ncbi:unnamed protein product [Lactuca saligna]|uniref:Gnk2-homologous domain-containing protein n=1 Tax=Lactuca saligna TaxID=75948 RepID=A0AA36EPH0_LACSI|nr:unnamed protein product [Lactuca saligna]
MGLQLTTPFILLVLSIYSSTSSYADLTTFVYKGCANEKFQDGYGISSQNLKSLYSNLISQSSTTNFYNTTTENAQLTTSITGVYQCRGDLSNSDCNTCIKKIPERIEKVCGGDTIAAIFQLDGCYMRYEVVGFPPTSAMELLYKQCASNRASGSGFYERLESTLVQIEKGIGNGKGHYAADYQSVVVLGQCEGDLGNADCVICVKIVAEHGSNVTSGTHITQTEYPDHPDQGKKCDYNAAVSVVFDSDGVVAEFQSGGPSGYSDDIGGSLVGDMDQVFPCSFEDPVAYHLRSCGDGGSAETFNNDAKRDMVEICFDFFSSVVCRKETERIGFRFSDVGFVEKIRVTSLIR